MFLRLLILGFCFFIFSIKGWSESTATDCQKKQVELLANTPNLNELVFHTKCGTLNMMEIQKASEIKYGSNTDFLAQTLEVARLHGVSKGIVVDLGSGTGVWTKYLLKQADWKVHAVDLFKPSLEDLYQSVSADEKERLVLHNVDFREMKFPEPIDFIIANNSLCFVPKNDLEAVIDSIYMNLKSGGIFAATFWGKGDIRGEDENLSTFTPAEVKALLEKKYTVLKCCNTLEGKDKNLDGEVVPWSVVYAIVKKP